MLSAAASISPGRRHLVLRDKHLPRIELRDGPFINRTRRRSITFNSAAELWQRAVAGLLTGMGEDGSLDSFRSAASAASPWQDRFSSVVFPECPNSDQNAARGRSTAGPDCPHPARRGSKEAHLTASTILIVDDSPSIRRPPASLRRRRTLEAVDGRDALDRLGELGEPVALAIVDINMPRLDGIALVRAPCASGEHPLVPILMPLTAETPGASGGRKAQQLVRWVGSSNAFAVDDVLALVQRLLRR